MLASELEDRLGEGVVHANMGTTQEMLSNMEQALVHQEKVRRCRATCGHGSNCLHARNSVSVVN